MLRKLSNKYQLRCVTYNTHDMTTCHEGTGHTGKGRGVDFHIEDTGGIDIGPDNDNGSTNSSDIMIACGGFDMDGHLSDLPHSSQANLTILTREINNLQ